MGLIKSMVAGLLAISWSLPIWAQELDVYKSQYCGCCDAWVKHMESAGFAVTAHNTEQMQRIKQQHGIPDKLASCHTALIGDYFIEGHVPATDIRRLLKEQPKDIVGLAVPGMPASAPGMDRGAQPYQVLAYRKDGSFFIYSRYND